MRSPQAHYSNRVEELFNQLKARLFHSSQPFARRLIVVPGPAMKAWLMRQLAEDPAIGIATGLEICYPDQAIKRLCESYGLSRQVPSRMTIALSIEADIRKVIGSSEELPLWKPIVDYLKLRGQPLSFSRKSQRRLTTLSDMLAKHFLQYRIYGSAVIKNKQLPKWQQELWNHVHEDESIDLLPFIENSSTKPKRRDVPIHLFGLSHLPKLYHRFMMRVSQDLPLNFYVLSPCQFFWSDLVSDRERERLEAYWKKRGVSSAQQQALSGFLRDRNPLLANWGKLGRETAKQLEESEVEMTERYLLSQAAASQEVYQERLTEDIELCDTHHPLHLLDVVQTDLALLRYPDKEHPVRLLEKDESIQVHISSNRMREVQILYDNLLGILNKHIDDPKAIRPGDILVMAPNIHEYAPYIEAVFGANDSLLEPQVMDMDMPSNAPSVRAFQQMLSLSFSRWEASLVLQLLDCESFQRKQGFSYDDVGTIREWTQSTGVRWGMNADHREELLRRDQCLQGMVDRSPTGTWEHGIDKLLSDLIIGDSKQVDPVQAALLGTWIYLLGSIRSALRCLQDNTEMTLEGWTTYLRDLYNRFLGDDDAESSEELEQFFSNLAKVKEGVEQKFSFHTIWHHLQSSFNQPHCHHAEPLAHKVRFCSLLPMRAIPAQVVAILGMDEGAYPRQEPTSTLNALKGNPQSDYCPSQVDYDRYLILEALLSARAYLLLSYVGYANGDSKERPPSLLVTELLNYLDRACIVVEKKPSQVCVWRHPHHPYDKEYFNSASGFRNFSQLHYQQAKAFYLGTSITGSESAVQTPIQVFSDRVAMHDLMALARNPIKTYLNKTLGIYLDNPEKQRIKDDEELYLNALHRYIIKKNAFTKPVDELLKEAHKSGLLPVGAFQPVIVEKLKQEIASIKLNLETCGVMPQDVFSITLTDRVQTPKRHSSGDWELPALEISYRDKTTRLTGVLSELSPQGMIATGKDDKANVVKILPQYLVLSCLAKVYDLPLATDLVIINEVRGKKKTAFLADPFSALGSYVEYYHRAQEQMSPLVPDWIPQLLDQDAQEFRRKVTSSVNDPFHPNVNEYLSWAVQKNMLPQHPEQVAYWRGWAEQLFASLYDNWYPQRKKDEG